MRTSTARGPQLHRPMPTRSRRTPDPPTPSILKSRYTLGRQCWPANEVIMMSDTAEIVEGLMPELIEDLKRLTLSGGAVPGELHRPAEGPVPGAGQRHVRHPRRGRIRQPGQRRRAVWQRDLPVRDRHRHLRHDDAGDRRAGPRHRSIGPSAGGPRLAADRGDHGAVQPAGQPR